MLTADLIISKYYINSFDGQTIYLSENSPDNKEALKHEISTSCFLSHKEIINPFSTPTFSDLTLSSLEKITDIEMLIIGTGKKQCFPAKDLYMQIQKLGYSIDFMETSAACRTYNILVNENRKIGALLFLN